jgi:hypothetical protein
MSYELYREGGKWVLWMRHSDSREDYIKFPTYDDACTFLVKLAMGD